MLLIDTDVLSASRRPETASSTFASWVRRVDPTTMFISAVSIREVRAGILRKLRRDPIQGAHLQRWMQDQILTRFQQRILAFDVAAALRCADLHVPNPAPERDAMIAATALVHGFTVVTRNVKDFRRLGVPLFNPWEAADAQ